MMKKKQQGIFLTLFGAALFIISLAFILPRPELYLLALVLMFVAVVLIGVGGAMMKEYDNSLDPDEEECYYCEGSGKIKESGESVVCPRCGGTGVAPDGTN